MYNQNNNDERTPLNPNNQQQNPEMNQQTPQKVANNNIIHIQKKEWIYVNPSIYLIYCLLNGISLILGCLLKLIKPITRETIGKKSILTGIPIIRNNYFVFPFILNSLYFIWCIYIYYSNTNIRMRFGKNLMEYLKNIRGCFMFTNITLLLLFYSLYYGVYEPIYKNYLLRISGHILASILSGGMIVNLHHTYEPFLQMKVGGNFSNIIFCCNMFLYYHSIYTIFWSSWIFHQVTELIISFIISVSFLFLVHVVNVDELMLSLFDLNYQSRSPNILYR